MKFHILFVLIISALLGTLMAASSNETPPSGPPPNGARPSGPPPNGQRPNGPPPGGRGPPPPAPPPAQGVLPN